MQILLPRMQFLLLLLSLVVVVAVVIAVVVVVLVAVILIVLVVNSTSSSCDSSKILTWTDKYKSWARAGKYRLRARAKVGAQAKGLGPGNTTTVIFCVLRSKKNIFLRK